jgi:hypothetical protein
VIDWTRWTADPATGHWSPPSGRHLGPMGRQLLLLVAAAALGAGQQPCLQGPPGGIPGAGTPPNPDLHMENCKEGDPGSICVAQCQQDYVGRGGATYTCRKQPAAPGKWERTGGPGLTCTKAQCSEHRTGSAAAEGPTPLFQPAGPTGDDGSRVAWPPQSHIGNATMNDKAVAYCAEGFRGDNSTYLCWPICCQGASCNKNTNPNACGTNYAPGVWVLMWQIQAPQKPLQCHGVRCAPSTVSHPPGGKCEAGTHGDGRTCRVDCGGAGYRNGSSVNYTCGAEGLWVLQPPGQRCSARPAPTPPGPPPVPSGRSTKAPPASSPPSLEWAIVSGVLLGVCCLGGWCCRAKLCRGLRHSTQLLSWRSTTSIYDPLLLGSRQKGHHCLPPQELKVRRQLIDPAH